ncbi:molybdopterin dinucleotide binding domain-containing protein [Neobacillus drentensis]|uniref:molybdopterin dinucleotide binding domain-containing protein n=1 Tax=Neobacillus drentensis TaxID=220684 RepID=UPI002FFE3775
MPLQCFTWKGRIRANSTFSNHAWLKEVAEQVLWINPADAEQRGIKKGDKVKIYNNRGIVMIPAEVTTRIMPGVVAMQAGAWYKPDKKESIQEDVPTSSPASASPRWQKATPTKPCS